MNSFHNIVQKITTWLILLIVAFVTTYTPQPFNEIKKAHALASGSVVSVPISDANSTVTSATTGSTAASTGVSAGLQTTLNYKELTLDGLMWAMAKQTLSNMVSSIINWINTVSYVIHLDLMFELPSLPLNQRRAITMLRVVQLLEL